VSTSSRIVFGLFATCASVWAQSAAQINGTINDASGLAVAGAEVKAIQIATGAVRVVVSGADGAYVLANLPIGPYQLEVSKEGFAKYVQSGIVLQVASNPTLDVALKVGAVTEQVLVQGNAAQVETQATGVGQVIDNQRVLELPLNARNSQQLILMAGTAVAGGTQSTNRGYPTYLISVGGGLNNGLTYVLDGGTHNEPYINASLPLPFPDALQEFKVETSSVPAQYGQHSAGAVTAVTKSGTNEFHGSAFEFLRNKLLNARNTFAATRDGLKRNQFGGVLGGPIMKNRLFFFFGDQFTRTRSVPTTVFDTIPTPQVLAGDWTAISSPACNGGRQITLKAPFVNNQISPALYSTPAVNLVKRFPTVTDPCGQDGFGRVNNSNEQFIVSRVDFQQSAKNSLFGRYMVARLDQIGDYNGTDPLSASQPNYIRRAHSLVLGDTYLLTNSMVSSFRATLIRTTNAKSIPDFFTFSDLGVKNVYYPPNYGKIAELTDGGLFTLFRATLTPGNTNGTDFQVAEDLSMTHGAHQIAYGADYIHAALNYLSGTQAPGAFTFAANNTGSAMGDMMLGQASRWLQSQLVGWYPRQTYLALYVQDTWKASSHLSVIAGLRWEPYISPYTKYIQSGVFSNDWFVQGLHTSAFKNAPAGLLFGSDPALGLGNSLDSNSWFHLAPRLGLAWDPKGDGRMVIRAAAGKFFDYTHFDTYGDLQNSPPTGGRASLSGVNFADPYNGYPGGSPYPLAFGPNAVFLPQATYLTVPQGIKHAYIEQWNISVQKQIGTTWLASASYMGNLGLHENQGHEGNPAVYIPGASCVINGVTYTPCSSVSNTNQRRLLALENPTQGAYFSNIEAVDSNGTRSYNGMILSIQRRAAKGVAVLANYTWSHCIDFQNTTNTNTVQTWDLNRLSHDRGNCELDRRHNFNLSTVYQTPQFSSRTTRLLASGWQISGIVSILSGPWLTVLSGNDNALTATGDQFPNAVLPSPYAPNRGGLNQWLNPAAFAQPALGTYGNMGPASVVGPGGVNIDVALARLFKIRERMSVMIRAEAFNVVNHVNPGDPTGGQGRPGGVDLTLTDGNFGKILTTNDPRIMQVAMKFVF
jgi:hypothetical protein